MAEKSKQPKLEQRLALEGSSKPRTRKDLIKQYVGKDVVLELGNIGTNISTGYLQEYDGKFVLIRDYKQFRINLSNYLEKSDDYLQDYPWYDIQNPASVEHSLPFRTINVNLIASIQTLEDVLEARKLED